MVKPTCSIKEWKMQHLLLYKEIEIVMDYERKQSDG